MTLGNPRVHRRQTGSTSLDARALAIAGAPHGTLVTAREQLDGRGRQGRRWHAPAGSALVCSVVLRDPPPLLSIVAGVAVAESIGESTTLKWPNDVLLEGRKVSGVLIEGRPQERWSVLGIGVNVALRVEELPEELRESAGTLGRSESDVEPLLERLLEVLEARLASPAEDLLAAWRSRDALLGRKIAWRDGRGTALGIDDRGALLVRLADGRERALDAGEVHLLADQ
ncbi:MAG TPA: biotin--[acetyl-CoA-carboxylase] ligase [Solirubrobacteraceae bacterium]|nr:biotin--[acetyl-CoA-carboxylase] ligase [Solirubrobacteraceae bacterium]